jgi:HPt (histidine-containing phosphotransfer) domain-containing protein
MGDANEIVDFEGFTAETGLDGETVKELYSGFIEELDAEKNKLFAELSAGSFSMLARTVHKIKGVSGSYRLQCVYKQAQELDARIKEVGPAGIEAAVKKLEILIDEAVAVIKNYYMI